MADIVWPQGEQFKQCVTLLNQLIGGRKDVVAKYHSFIPDGKTETVKGYSPWRGKRVSKDYVPGADEVVRERKLYGTQRIEYNIMRPLSDANLDIHCRGKELLGVYALDKNFCSSFLAADFDDHEGVLDPAQVWAQVKHFAEICETHDFYPNIERSKSGNGYHVWVFFSEPVPAAKVRGVGRWLMEEADVIRDGESFDTFDRFFPVQSELAPGLKGFGNLIAIPMCGRKAYSQGRTAWVDFDNEIVLDPFAHLQDIQRNRLVAPPAIDAFMKDNDIEPAIDHYSPGGEDKPAVVGADVLAGVAEGGRNEAIFKYAASLRAKKMAIEEARVLVYAAADKSNFDEAEAEQCLQSAFKYQNNPRQAQNNKTTGANVPPENFSDAPEIDFSDVPIDPDSGLPWPTIIGYEISSKGLKDHQTMLCAKPLWVDSVTVNIFNEYGVRIRFFDLDWVMREHVFPRVRLYEQGGVLARELSAYGCPIIPGKEKMISRYIVTSESYTTKRIMSTERLGWFHAQGRPPVFVMPNGPIGDSETEIVYQSKSLTAGAEKFYTPSPGVTLEGWQQSVAAECAGNPMLMFGIMVALAGPLLTFAREQSGGYHIYGDSTAGKTTLLQAAASVWGCGADPQQGPDKTSIRKWYTTGAALETMAEIHNDTAIMLDEVSEVDPHELGKIIYNLAGGVSKARGNADGGMRDMRTWHLMILSTGEKSVSQIISAAGGNTKAGQRVRLTDLPVATDVNPSGVIVTHTGDKAALLSDRIKAAAATNYGVAGPAFVAHLLNTIKAQGITTFSQALRTNVLEIEQALSFNASGEKENIPAEGKRILKRLSLVCAAGVLARDAGVLRWEVADIMAAIVDIRDRWLSDLGRYRSEGDRGLQHLRGQLFNNIDRFKTPGDTSKVMNLLGARLDSGDLMVFTQPFIELCGEFDHKAVLRSVRDKGWLKHDRDRLSIKTAVPLNFLSTTSRPRVYHIKAEFMDESTAAVQHEILAAEDDGVVF